MPAVKTLSLVLTLGVLVACGPEGPVVSGTPIERHTDLDAQAGASTVGVRSHARILFATPLKGINSREHYVLEFEAVSEGSQLTVHSHLSGFAWLDGVDVRFVRRGADLQVLVGTPGFAERPLGVIEGVFTHSPWVRMRLEVHDGGVDGVRILVWRDWIDYQRPVRRARDRIQAETADLDSRESKLIFLSHGRGARWGLTAQGVALRAATREGPYVQR